MKLRLLSLFGDLRHLPPLRRMRRFGVPPGGPADGESAALAAALVGCSPECVAELAFGQATFLVDEGGTLGIVGIGRAERLSLSVGETVLLSPKGGARLVLAAPQGWETPPLGADPDASLALHPGDSLVAPPIRELAPRRLYVAPEAVQPLPIRVVAGPQRAFWTGSECEFKVTSLLDRRGIRLSGAPEHGHEIVSEPCIPGVIQWTPNGELILLGPDGPTIGGYPKPFVVIAADLPKLGQLLPGQHLCLGEMDPQSARQASRDAEVDLARRLFMIGLAGSSRR